MVVTALTKRIFITMATPETSENSDKDLQKVVKELVQESLSSEIQRFKEAALASRSRTDSTVEGKH